MVEINDMIQLAKGFGINSSEFKLFSKQINNEINKSMVLNNVNIIVAASSNDCIGIDGGLPWDLPTDLKRFKRLTSGGVVIMGRKTWESLPDKSRPLPDRTNIVLSNDKTYIADGAKVKHNLIEALSEYPSGEENIFIIGGGVVYKEAFKYANTLHITRVIEEIEGDIYLEGLEPEEWVLIGFEGPYKEDGYDYRFETYRNKKRYE